MGVFKEKMIIKFLSSRLNLFTFQLLMYGVIGYIMYIREFTWVEMSIIFISVYGIQFITRVKAVADGMLFRQLMVEHDIDANEVVRRIKKIADYDKKNNNIN